MENIKGSVYYPHFFQSDAMKKEVIAICKVILFKFIQINSNKLLKATNN
jgi:hypothetical protein